MPNIKFSYIFHDCFERILQSFEEVSVSDSFAHPLSKLNFYKGQRFDEDNAEFSFCWKNYYEMKMVVEKVIKRPFIKSYTHRTIYIDKLPINLSFTFNFFWDSINETTILVIDLEYQDDFFTDLIKTDFSSKDKINICKIDAKQEKELKNSFEMINLKEELSSKRKLLLTKRKEYDELKQGITIKNMNEMNSKLESIRVNEIKLQNEVTSSQEKLIKNTEITHKLEKDIESQEKINEELSKQEADYEKRYSNKLNEVKEIEKDIGSIESRRKNKITKITNNVNFSGGKLKGIRLKSKIFKIKNDINKIQEYKSNERDDLIKKLEQKRAIVSELKKTNLDLETKIKDLEIKNTQLYVEVNKNIQEKSILENRGKEQMKDLKKIKELEKTIYELKMVKDKLIKDFEERQKYLNDMKKTDKKAENNNDKENDKLETIKE